MDARMMDGWRTSPSPSENVTEVFLHSRARSLSFSRSAAASSTLSTHPDLSVSTQEGHVHSAIGACARVRFRLFTAIEAAVCAAGDTYVWLVKFFFDK